MLLLAAWAQADLRTQHLPRFWAGLQACARQTGAEFERGLLAALQGLSSAVQLQAQQLAQLVQQLVGGGGDGAGLGPSLPPHTVARLASLPARHQTAVASLLLSSAPLSVTGGCRPARVRGMQALPAGALERPAVLGMMPPSSRPHGLLQCPPSYPAAHHALHHRPAAAVLHGQAAAAG